MKECCSKKFSRRCFLEKTGKLYFSLGLSSLLLDVGKAEAASNTGSGFEPAYLKLHKTGELKKRAEELWAIMKSCQLCPRRCGVNRHKGMSGVCRAPGTTLVVSSAHPHFGEERPLVGKGGSGTIFLSHCNLRCVFCQNWEISILGRGDERNIDEFASMMLKLQEIGCHNINLVTPTHYSAHILKAIDVAAERGLRLPIVYNTSGILEMHRQVGVAKPAKDGIMQRGLMIRHLVMPNNTAGSVNVMEWIAGNLPKDTYVNIMGQYTPVYKAYDYPELSRRITKKEYMKVVTKAKDMGLTNLDIQRYWWLK
jgi:putative pyruvate formate lyase activating enzyme